MDAAEPDDTPLQGAFSVQKQRLEFDFSFCPRLIKGKTTIDLLPHSTGLKEIRLHCRQLKPTRITVENKEAPFSYSNLYERLQLHSGTGLQQYHFPQQRLRHHEEGTEEELVIFMPDKVRIREYREEGALAYTPLKVVIEYILDEFRDGVHFAGVEDGDARYPHAYTRNSPFPGMASCLFPCIDDGRTRCNFDVAIRYPRTVGYALCKSGWTANAVQIHDLHKADSIMSESEEDLNDLTEEEKALEMSVICSGMLTDDITDRADPSRATASFSIATETGVLPQHVGIVIGPFQHVDLSEYRDISDEDRLREEAIKVHAFCLPGKEDEARNSAMMLARTLDNFTERYQTYRFGKSYKLAFVDDLDCDTSHTASLSICSSRLLFPETVWEPLEHTTRVLIHAVASQWIGVDLIAQSPSDYWVIFGGSWFMTEFYLRELFGRNDHRFRQKLMVDRIMQMDIRRPSLYKLGKYLSLDPGEQDFLQLKSLSVLSILHNRLVKASGKNGVDRCLYRMLFMLGNGSLDNGAISTEEFRGICEKVGHQKLENFFKQWVYGAGCPTFECFPQFNKKKQVIQLTIKQTQGDSTMTLDDHSLSAGEFMREARERAHGFYPDNEWPAFVGPMTIRIHEADGTPYEHIVDINASNVKVEIPYNTKYKRLKRNRLNKERMAAAQGLDATGDTQDEITFYSLGDLFQTPEEAKEWRISDWPPEDEQRMDAEAYEWIRVDADFEWICRANINDMPSYMYVSQLQQDKDVVAQAESIQYLSLKEGHPLISSFLVKTLMDGRYFHGIRTMAAEVLAASAKDSIDWIGFFHLKKAFQELFCLPNSPMTRPNDFSDRSSYLIQCAIPRAISKIKRPDGKAPMEVKRFLLDIIRYNDNRGNDYSDDHYLATLMRCLADCLASSKQNLMNQDPTLSLIDEAEEFDFARKAIEELERHQRLDEWIPTYQNIYTTTALDCAVKLIKSRVRPFKISDFLQYAQIGNADNVRLKAWECLVQLGVFHKKDSVIRYMMHEISSDPSPYFRTAMLRIFGIAVGQIAVGEVFVLEDPIETANGGLVLEEEAGVSARAAEIARRGLQGALRGLRADLGSNETLKKSLEAALKSKSMSARDVSELLDFCAMVVDRVDKLEVTLKYPHYWEVQHLGAGRVRFFRSDRIRTKPIERPVAQQPQPAAIPPPPPPALPAPLATKTTGPRLNLKLAFSKPGPPSASVPSSAPQPPSTDSHALGGSERRSSEWVASTAIKSPSPVSTSNIGQGLSLALPAKSPSPAAPPAALPTALPTALPSRQSSGPKPSAPKPSAPKTSAETLNIGSPPPPAPPKASPAPPTPAPVPTPAPTIKIKAPPAPPKPQTAAPKSKPMLKIGKGKKSRIVTLRLPSEELARFNDGSSRKRKAEGDLGQTDRPAKRLSTEPPVSNGMGMAHGQRVSLEKVERTASEPKRLMLKLSVGRANLPNN